MAPLPTGTVTFLFTDIEGSTELVRRLGPRYAEVLEAHQRLLRDAFADGAEISTEGDSFFVAFDSATKAVAAAASAQAALAAHDWPDGQAVGVRMGLHTGQPSLGGENYVGLDVHRAARIAAAGHGGQVLISESTHALVSRELPDGIGMRDLGEHRLKDLAKPERLFQLVIPGLTADFPALRSLDVSRTNLPSHLTSFVGREREVADLKALATSHRLVTVIGTGGTGKTRLAIQAAADLVGHYPDGVWLVELAPIQDPQLIVQAVARTLGVRDEPGRPIFDTLVDYLRSKSLLLLLDNCEHVIGSAAQLVEGLLGSCPALAVLASSREALGVPGESVFQVPSLGLPRLASAADEHEGGADAYLAEAAAAEAVRLFVDRATAISPSFSVGAADIPAVVEICRRLDGIPLAIELAAARVGLLSVHEIALRLGDRFRLLTGGRRTAVPRQQTLQALIDWSWDLLTDADRRLLRHLSVFSDGWTLEAGAVVTGDAPQPAADDASFETLEGIGRLVDRSLVIADRRPATRYRMLETIRQYARDRLVESGEAPDLRSRHLAYFRRIALEAAPQLRGPDMVAALDRLDSEADNLRTALEWAFEADLEVALGLCVSLAIYWRARSMVEGLDRLTQAVDRISTLPPPVPATERERASLVARLLATAATSAWIGGNATAALRWAGSALDMARSTADVEALYLALGAMAMATVFSGGETGVVEWTEEAIRLAEGLGDWDQVSFATAGLAQWEVERGNIAAAEGRLARAMQTAQRSGNPSVIAFAAMTSGRISSLGGRTSEARRWLETAFDAYEEIGDPRMALVSRSDLGHSLRIGGEIDEAEQIYRETLHGWLHAGNRGAIANQLESFAFVAITRRNFTHAARLFGAAEAIREVAHAAMGPYEHFEYEAAVASLHEQLEGSALESAWAEGRQLSTDAAAKLALSAEPPT